MDTTTSSHAVNTPKTYVILLLAATTLGGAILAWRQYRELAELRAAGLNRAERADLQKRVWDLEKQNRELQGRVGSRREGAEGESAAAEGERPRGGRGGDRSVESRGRGPGEMQQANALRELMSKPEVQAMLNLQQKAAIEGRYAALFKNLNLSSDQVEKLKALLAERSTTTQDVLSVAREQGINPRENPDAFQKLIADAQNEINRGIKSVIGEQGFAQLTTYEQTLPQRNLVNELQQRLSYTNTPLTATQAEQLVHILAANQPPRQSNVSPAGGTDVLVGAARGGPPPGRGPDVGSLVSGVLGPGMGAFVGAMDGARSAAVTPAAIAQAQTVLAPPQVSALQQIQQQQQSQQQLRQLVNDTLSANQNQAGGSPAPKSGPPPRR